MQRDSRAVTDSHLRLSDADAAAVERLFGYRRSAPGGPAAGSGALPPPHALSLPPMQQQAQQAQQMNMTTFPAELGLSTQGGDTARIKRESGGDFRASLDSAAARGLLSRQLASLQAQRQQPQQQQQLQQRSSGDGPSASSHYQQQVQGGGGAIMPDSVSAAQMDLAQLLATPRLLNSLQMQAAAQQQQQQQHQHEHQLEQRQQQQRGMTQREADLAALQQHMRTANASPREHALTISQQPQQQQQQQAMGSPLQGQLQPCPPLGQAARHSQPREGQQGQLGSLFSADLLSQLSTASQDRQAAQNTNASSMFGQMQRHLHGAQGSGAGGGMGGASAGPTQPGLSLFSPNAGRTWPGGQQNTAPLSQDTTDELARLTHMYYAGAGPSPAPLPGLQAPGGGEARPPNPGGELDQRATGGVTASMTAELQELLQRLTPRGPAAAGNAGGGGNGGGGGGSGELSARLSNDALASLLQGNSGSQQSAMQDVRESGPGSGHGHGASNAGASGMHAPGARDRGHGASVGSEGQDSAQPRMLTRDELSALASMR
jgi:hypothetical protein